jgi:tetratricopeptide (TPR) repeat protein
MPTLALCMIVRDEEAMLPACLGSVAGVVDEIVVVDTGSTDGTVAIAEAAGARVYAHAWTDDFAEARNAALSHVTADWALVLDADERLGPGAGAALRAALARGGAALGHLPLHDASDEAAPVESVLEGRSRAGEPVLVPRLVRVSAAPRWTGRVRESLEDAFVSGVRAVVVPAPIVHYGWVPSRRAARGASDRNVRLLRRRCEAEPGDARVWTALASELADRGERGAALRAADTAWRCVRAAWARGETPRAVAAACVRADLLGRLGRDAEVLAMFDAIAARPGGSGHPDVPFRRAGVLAEVDPRAALAQYREALAFHGKVFDTPVSPGATSHASLLGLARLALVLGRTAMARDLATGACASVGAPWAAHVVRAECDVVDAPELADARLARLGRTPGGDVALLRAACAEARGDAEGLRRHLAAFEEAGALDDPRRQVRALYLRVASRLGPGAHVVSGDVDGACQAASEVLADGEAEQAIAWSRAALRRDPRCGRAWMSLVLALRLAGRPGYAVLAARGAAHAVPDDVDVLVVSALAHEAAGDLATAVECARSVLRRDGRHREARGVLARTGVHAPADAGGSPALCVVVRVGDAPDSVVGLLDRLALQEPGGPAFEVVLCGVEGVSVLVLPGPRPYALRYVHARTEADAWNAGWRAATAPVVLFLEPDAVPGPELVASCVREHVGASRIVLSGSRLHPSRFESSGASLLFARRLAATPTRMHGLSVERRLLDAHGGFRGAFRHADALATDLRARLGVLREAVREAEGPAISRTSPSDLGAVLSAETVLGADAVTWLRLHGTPATWEPTLDEAALASASERLEAGRIDAEACAFIVAQACHLGPSAEVGGRVAVDTCLTRLAGWHRIGGALEADAAPVPRG